MTELFERVEDQAGTQARAMGFTVLRVVSTSIQRVEAVGEPRYTVVDQVLNADVLHRRLIRNCGLSELPFRLSFSERRQYSFTIDLDARLRAAATGMASAVQVLAVPTISSSTTTQQVTLNLELTQGSAIRGHTSFERVYTEDTSYSARPCTITRYQYRAQNRTVSGTLTLELRILALVTLELRLDTPAGAVTFPLPLPVDLRTTASGRFSGLVADDMQVDVQQIGCRVGDCGALSNDQIGRLWGLDGAPAGAIPVEFDDAPRVREDDIPEGRGKCYPKSRCSGGSYPATYDECVADPVASSWRGPDGACYEIRPDD